LAAASDGLAANGDRAGDAVAAASAPRRPPRRASVAAATAGETRSHVSSRAPHISAAADAGLAAADRRGDGVAVVDPPLRPPERLPRRAGDAAAPAGDTRSHASSRAPHPPSPPAAAAAGVGLAGVDAPSRPRAASAGERGVTGAGTTSHPPSAAVQPSAAAAADEMPTEPADEPRPCRRAPNRPTAVGQRRGVDGAPDAVERAGDGGATGRGSGHPADTGRGEDAAVRSGETLPWEGVLRDGRRRGEPPPPPPPASAAGRGMDSGAELEDASGNVARVGLSPAVFNRGGGGRPSVEVLALPATAPGRATSEAPRAPPPPLDQGTASAGADEEAASGSEKVAGRITPAAEVLERLAARPLFGGGPT